jgi:hypothetical protein
MSEFFSHYPQVSYDVSGDKPAKYRTAINVMTRSKMKDVVGDDVVSYFPYNIPENERPDTTSFKFYGDVKFTWLIFLINDIHDPIYEWPLGAREFVTFIIGKYGSVNTAKNTIHHYEQEVRARREATGATESCPRAIITIDETTYSSLPSDQRAIVYNFENEINHNESKREIKMIDSKYVSMIFGEHAEKYKG